MTTAEGEPTIEYRFQGARHVLRAWRRVIAGLTLVEPTPVRHGTAGRDYFDVALTVGQSLAVSCPWTELGYERAIDCDILA